MSVHDVHALPSLPPSACGSGRTERKKQAHPSVPFGLCHDFSPKWLLEGSCRRKKDMDGLCGRWCLLHLSAFRSSPGLSEHGPLGLSAPLAGGGLVAPWPPVAWVLVNTASLGVTQTGWTCVQWACPLLTLLSQCPSPANARSKVKVRISRRHDSVQAYWVWGLCLHLAHACEAGPGATPHLLSSWGLWAAPLCPKARLLLEPFGWAGPGDLPLSLTAAFAWGWHPGQGRGHKESVTSTLMPVS